MPSDAKWVCEWRGSRFVFVAPSGYRQTFSGPRSAVVATLRRVLPAWVPLAANTPDLQAMMQAELDALGEATDGE